MKKALIALCLLFVANNSYSVYIPKKEIVPQELSDILMELQAGELYPEHKKEIDKLIISIDKAFSLMNKEDIYFFCKSEVYKTLLSAPPTKFYSHTQVSKNMHFNLESIKSNFKSNFLLWLISSVQTDLRNITYDKSFNSYQKNRHKINLNPQDIKIKKRLSLLLPWYNYFMNTDPEEVREGVYSSLMSSLRAIYVKTTQYARLTGGKLPKNAPLKYFERQNIKQIEHDNSPLSTLDSIIEEKVDSVPKPVNGWLSKKDDFAIKHTPLVIPSVDPDYTAPKELPQPTGEWTQY